MDILLAILFGVYFAWGVVPQDLPYLRVVDHATSLAVIAAAACYAVGNIVFRTLLHGTDPVSLSALQLVAATALVSMAAGPVAASAQTANSSSGRTYKDGTTKGASSGRRDQERPDDRAAAGNCHQESQARRSDAGDVARKHVQEPDGGKDEERGNRGQEKQ